MAAKISQEEYENRINKLLDCNKYEYIGIKEEFRGNKTRILISCNEHGQWESSFDSFLSGRKCPKCGYKERARGQRMPVNDREKHIQRLCKGTLYSFVRWEHDYKNSSSKFICKCEIHGEWSVSIDNFKGGKRCPSCSPNTKRYSEEEREEQVRRLCEGTIYSFLCWDGGYRNVKSIITLNCLEHGIQKISIDKFIHAHQRCNECSHKKDGLLWKWKKN